MSGKKILIGMMVILGLLWAQCGLAFQSFTIRAIQFQGLQGITRSTVMNYMPLRVGDRLTDQNSSRVIQSLYQTGFFTDVRLARSGNTLVVKVIERPIISSITLLGNKTIKSDKLRQVLRRLGIAEGLVFNRSTLEKVKYSLQSQYDELGKYNARVSTDVKSLPRNRVAITIDVSEGRVSKISSIRIIGNHAFTEHTLLKQFELGTPNLLSFFTKNDQYTAQKLDKDLTSLRDYYMNHGYIAMKIVSSNVSLTPDKKHVYIEIHITEGQQYKFIGYRVTGDLPIKESVLVKGVDLPKNTVFARKVIIAAQKLMGHTLGVHGYAYAMVQVIPVVDEKAHTVFINYHIMAGRRYYVRHITFSGNTKTQDVALRKVMQQMEGGMVNLKKIDDSTRNLNLLGFVKDVHHNFTRVPGKNNQLDLNMHVKEMPSATVTAGVGYSTDQKFLVSASFNQPNFMGTGRALGINFSNSAILRSYSVSYSNPFYTVDGISRTFNFFVQRYNPGKLSELTSSYTYNIYGGNVSYGIPINNYNRVSVGGGFQHIRLLTGSGAPQFVTNFLAEQNQNTTYNEITLSSNWLFNTFDRAIFPTKGLETNIGGTLAVPADKKSLHYYKLSATATGYLPLDHMRNWILTGKAGAVYGNGYGSTTSLPFFANYFGGGIDTDVPDNALDANSLGPKDEFGDAIGGNVGYFGLIGMIVPQFNENVRTIAFIQGAKLYNSKPNSFYSNLQAMDQARKMRYAYGVMVEWRTIFAPLDFSFARAFRTYCTSSIHCDNKDPFQFTIAANL